MEVPGHALPGELIACEKDEEEEGRARVADGTGAAMAATAAAASNPIAGPSSAPCTAIVPSTAQPAAASHYEVDVPSSARAGDTIVAMGPNGQLVKAVLPATWQADEEEGAATTRVVRIVM